MSCIYIQRSEGSPLQVPVVSFVMWVSEIKPQAGLHMPLSAKPSPGYSTYFLYASETSLIWSRLTLNLALQLRMILNCPASNHLARHCIHTIGSVTCSESVWEGLCEAPVTAVSSRWIFTPTSFPVAYSHLQGVEVISACGSRGCKDQE